jgi:hypothetical protein
MGEKLLLFSILAVSEVALGLLYGFLLQSVLSVALTLLIGFSIAFVILVIFYRDGEGNLKTRILTVLVSSLIFMWIPMLTFFGVNQLFLEVVREYDVIAEHVSGRAGGSVDFTTPDGGRGNAWLHDYSPFHFTVDGEDRFVEAGDRIRVREYRGIFGLPYYEFLEEIR